MPRDPIVEEVHRIRAATRQGSSSTLRPLSVTSKSIKTEASSKLFTVFPANRVAR
jgi:hypothetical protein